MSSSSNKRTSFKVRHSQDISQSGRATASTTMFAGLQHISTNRPPSNQFTINEVTPGLGQEHQNESCEDQNQQSIFENTQLTKEVSLFPRRRNRGGVISLLPAGGPLNEPDSESKEIMLQSEINLRTSIRTTPKQIRNIKLKKFQNHGLHGRELYVQSCRNVSTFDHEQRIRQNLAEEAQERLMRKQLVGGSGFESVEQIIQTEKQKLDEMNEQVKKGVELKLTTEALESPAAQSPSSFGRSPNRRGTKIKQTGNLGGLSPARIGRRSSSMIVLHPLMGLGSRNNSPNKHQQSAKVSQHNEVQSKKESLVQRYAFANEQVEHVNQTDFYKTVKQFNKIEMYKEVHHQRDNVYVGLVKSNLKNNSLPKSLPFVKSELNGRMLQSVCMQRSTKNMLMNSVSCLISPQCDGVNIIDVSKTKLSHEFLSEFLTVLPKPVHTINLSSSSLDLKSITILAAYLKGPNEIKNLNLEQNRFSDKGCIKILESIPENSQLKILNLSKNGLTDNACEAIGTFLKKTSYLRELYLHFNNINQTGGANIFRSLQKCRPLKVLDLSFNQLGNQNQFHQLSFKKMYNLIDKKNILMHSECLQNIIKFLTKTSEVVHLDVSHNRFSLEETKEIEKALKQNQSIFGFHFEGNQPDYVIDIFGFMQTTASLAKTQLESALDTAQRYEGITLACESQAAQYQFSAQENKALKNIEDNGKQINQQHRHRRIDGVNPIRHNQQLRGLISLDTCWICEGFVEVKIIWNPQRSGRIHEQPLFLHVSVNDYRPMLMTKLYEEFFCFVMCPPQTTVKYFFTNPVMGIATYAREQLIIDLDESDPLRQPQVFVYNGDIIVDGPSQRQVNFLYTGTESKVIDENVNYVASVFARPREDQKKFDFTPFLGKVNRGWQLENSIFNNYRVDNDVLLEECFDFDFGSSKIARLVRDEAESVHQILQDYYPLLFNSYKYYASFGSIYNLPCISVSTFYDFLSSTTIMEGGRIKSTDIDVLFVSSNGKDQNYPQVFEKAIVRYQYMELIVRIAIDKYYKSGVTKAAGLAVMKLFEADGVKDWLEHFDSAQEWRDHRLWNEPNDKLLTQVQPFLRMLFKYTASINPKTKYYKLPWVSAQDFRDLMLQVGAICDYLSEREVYQAYLSSMMTQVDELFQPRHYQMNYYEFMEALARCAEKLSIILPIPGQNAVTVTNKTHEDKWHMDLNRKMHGFLMNIYFRIGDKVKESQKTSPDEDFFKFDSCMMSEKNYKRLMQRNMQLPNAATNKNIAVRTPPLPKTSFFRKSDSISSSDSDSNSSSSSSSSFSSEDSDKSLELQLKENIIQDQLKDAQKIQSKKNLSAIMRGAVNKIKQEHLSHQFNMSSIVKFLARRNHEANQARETINKQMGIF